MRLHLFIVGLFYESLTQTRHASIVSKQHVEAKTPPSSKLRSLELAAPTVRVSQDFCFLATGQAKQALKKAVYLIFISFLAHWRQNLKIKTFGRSA